MVIIADAMEGVVDGPGEHGDIVWVETIACEDGRVEETAAESSDDYGLFHLGSEDLI